MKMEEERGGKGRQGRKEREEREGKLKEEIKEKIG